MIADQEIREALGLQVPGLSLDPSRTALILVEFIYGHMHPNFGAGPQLAAADIDGSYFFTQCSQRVLPHGRLLAEELRPRGGKVLVTSTGSAFGDYKEIAPGVRPVIEARGHRKGSREVEVLDDVADVVDIVVNKVGSGAWATTNIDDVLRFSGIDTLLFAGVHTHGAVLMSAHWAWDLGYETIVVSDACTTLGDRLHQRALSLFRNLGIRVHDTHDVLSALLDSDAKHHSDLENREDQ